jgi:hypothetical protein
MVEWFLTTQNNHTPSLLHRHCVFRTILGVTDRSPSVIDRLSRYLDDAETDVRRNLAGKSQDDLDERIAVVRTERNAIP